MNDETRRLLAEGQVDVDGALHRVLGNEELLIRVLKKFPDGEHYEKIANALSQGDIKAAGEHLHNLKGVSGNLGLTRLYELSEEALVPVRKGLEPGNMDEIEEVYRTVVRALRALP